VIDAALSLLDRQLVDCDGYMAGKVDDLELAEGEDGVPYVTTILCGPNALARRLGGNLGRWLESVHRRLHPSEHPEPVRVPFGLVKRIDNHVELSVSKDELDVSRLEKWMRDNVVDKIPGAGRAPE
jgi:hypothetical protein